MRTISKVVLCVLGIFALSCCRCEAKPQRPYWLDISNIANSSSHQYRLRERGTGKIVWSQILGPGGKILWSSDGRAVAIHTYTIKTGSHEVLIWRVQNAIWKYDISGVCDYIIDWSWSSGNRHLLMRVGGSGMTDINLGILYNLDANTKKFHFIAGNVNRMKWVTGRKVTYWTMKNKGGGLGYEVSKRPCVWRAPK